MERRDIMKRIVSLVLVFVLCLSLWACAANDQNPETDPTGTEHLSTVGTDGTEGTEGTDTTEVTDPTDTSETTDPTDASEVTDPTEVTEEMEATSAPTEAPTTPPTTPPETKPPATTPPTTPHQHNYVKSKVIAPSCESLGYTIYACKCGATQDGNFVDATGHNYGSWKVIQEATKEKPGKMQSTCSICKDKITKEYEYNRFQGVTVSIAVKTDSKADDLWLFKQIEEEFGCNIEIVEIDYAVWNDKLSALLAKNELPTILTDFTSVAQIVELGEQGYFVDVMAPENLEKMPNFAKIFVEDKQIHKNYMMTAAKDGSHYLLPKYDCERDVNHYWIYNETAFKKAGVEWSGDAKNGGFLNMLRQLKAYYPQSYPWTGGAWQGTLDRMIYSWGVNSSYAAYNWDTGTWYYGATTNEYYDMLKLAQTAYKEGLMNPDLLTQGNGAIQDDMMNHEGFLYNSWLGWMTMHNTAFVDGNVDDHEIPTPTPVGTNGKTMELAKYNIFSGTLISAKDPEAAECAMAIMNWMYDTSKSGGAWLNTVGTSEMLKKDSNGRYSWIDDGVYGGVSNDINYVAAKYGMFTDALSVRYCPESPYFTFNKEEQMAQDIGAKIGYFPAPPSMAINDTNIADAYTASQMDIRAMTQKFIFENWSRADFDAWVKEFNDQYAEVMVYLNNQ